MTHVSLDAGHDLVARTRRIDPGDLIERLDPEGFAWLNGESGFVTSGVAARVRATHAADVLHVIAHDRDAGLPSVARPRAVGALPFDLTSAATLVIPAVIVARDDDGVGWCTTIGRAHAPAPLHVAPPRPAQFGVAQRTTLASWTHSVDTVLAAIGAGDVEKVVLARAVDVDADLPFDLRAVAAELRRTQPGCTVYASEGFVGASPELLVRKLGDKVCARPLAGTEIDAARLLASEKDAHEHRVVVDAVVGALARLCDGVVAEGPAPLRLADITHLATTVTAECSDPATSVVDLVRALHPTPAVAGTPRDAAIEMIRRFEPVDRGLYAGPCGWVDATGNGEFVVALRGAQIYGSHARLHAGAGIVAGSDAACEWAETQQKLEPMLRALVRP